MPIKERGILMKGEMVRAILDGRKTMTRRIMNPQPGYRENESVPGSFGTFFHGWNLDHPLYNPGDITKYCPYGVPGDRLWVRETWNLRHINGGSLPNMGAFYTIQFKEGFGVRDYEPSLQDIYGEVAGRQKKWKNTVTGDRVTPWKPSIHMFRWMSRILLEVTKVRVERLQDISEEDAIAEGFCESNASLNMNIDLGNGMSIEGGNAWTSAVGNFMLYIEKIQGEGSTMTNLWQWVVEFKDITNEVKI